MPDRFNFDHLPHWGQITHRCIEEGCQCEGSPLSERERRAHFKTHERERKRERNKRQHVIDQERRRNLAKARKAKAEKEIE